MDKNVCVVIPIYKERPSKNELRSIRRGLEVFKTRDIYYVMPQGLKLKNYPAAIPVEFPKPYFEDLQSYSDLCCLHDFYHQFMSRGYDYMMIYQPDCWVFEDRLDEYMAMGYGSWLAV